MASTIIDLELFQKRLNNLREWKFQALLRLDELMFVNPSIDEPVKRTESKNRLIDSFTDSQIRINFNFKKIENRASKTLSWFFIYLVHYYG